MKRILAIICSAACITIFSASGNAAQWFFSGSGSPQADTSKEETGSFAAPLTAQSNDALEVFSSANFAAFAPVQMDRFAISLIDTSDTRSTSESDASSLPRLQLNTGVATEKHITEPRALLGDTAFGNDPSEAFQVETSVLFIGLGLDFDSGYVKGNAFLGRPVDDLTKKLGSPQESPQKSRQLNTDAYGFEASAGYQLSNAVSLGGGIGKMTDKNKETEKTEEVYAVYAQAIVAVAPGVQVKPEVGGQVGRVKDKSEPEEVDESFYAGAIWEINF